MSPVNWFGAGGGAYARFRPEYPAELVDFLLGIAPGRRLAVDVGCGSGQLTTALAAGFERVLGLDPSQSQLDHALAHPRVEYRCAGAEALPVPDGTVDLITAAQAAHWFDLPAFYAEVRRVAAPGASLALITYGRQELDTDLNERFQRFYADEIGPFWPPERALVDAGYRTLEFPFDELPTPALEIRKSFDLAGLIGYLSTWSAATNAREAGRADLLENYAEDLARAWGDPARERPVRWPISIRLGRVT